MRDLQVGDKVEVIAQIDGTFGLKDPVGLTGVVDGVAPAQLYPISVTLDFSELEYEEGVRVSPGEYPEFFLPGELRRIRTE